MRPAIWGSLCLALAGHAALWAAMAAPARQAPHAGSTPTLQVRLQPAPAGQALTPAAAPANRADRPPVPQHEARLVATAEEAPATGPRYYAATEVDRPALPRSSPDPAMLDGTAPSGLPIRLRLYISPDGAVTQVVALFAAEQDEPVVERLREMFQATGFMPASRHGREVASYQDIDVDLADVTGALN
ncbi:hypothetical protein [Methylibium rhizosphaerae]|uniref:hypothetical protein n=1 Tax=Methylibium rhizosphaerae TaxID=2570323 RepID=UPI0011287B6C|nr:hypothetical protein [Methylibium rhizosphaerae]